MSITSVLAFRQNLPVVGVHLQGHFAGFDRCKWLAVAAEPVHLNDRLSAAAAIHGCAHSWLSMCRAWQHLDNVAFSRMADLSTA